MSEPERFESAGAGLSIWREAPSLGGARTAALGTFVCDTPDAGAALIARAATQLAGEGFGAVIGPMDGDTWSAHRLVIESDGSEPFLMEPANPPHHPAAFNTAGFDVAARYVSSITRCAAPLSARLPQGVTLRAFDATDADHELARLHDFSLQAFARNAFYKPISRERFFSMYRPVLGAIDADLAILAEDESSALVGFCFAIPNYAEGATPRSVILKTLASSRKGVGSALADELHSRAARKGFERVIHALMHESNASVHLSERFGGRVFRRYALWSKTL